MKKSTKFFLILLCADVLFFFVLILLANTSLNACTDKPRGGAYLDLCFGPFGTLVIFFFPFVVLVAIACILCLLVLFISRNKKEKKTTEKDSVPSR